MNDKTRDNRGLWDAGALAVAAAVTVLATACGGGSAPSAASTAAAYTQQTLAHRGSSIDVGSSKVPTAYDGCQYLQPGTPSIGQLEQKVGHARQEEARALPELRKYFQCVHSHGGPNQGALRDCQQLLPPGTHASINVLTPAS